jgi:hypothetical protein
MSEQLWASVDELTKPRHVKLLRDDGTADWTTLPSLWWQLEDAGVGMGDSGGGAGSASRYRAPGSVECMQLCYDIRDTVLDALISHEDQDTALWLVRGEQPRMLVPEAIRHLASLITAVGDDDLTGWWTYRVRSWSRQIINTLRLTDQPQPRRIRDTQCVTCGSTHVTIDQGSGPEWVPALLIEFQGALVRAASCSACGSNWFRGQELVELAEMIRVHRTAS